MAEIPLLSPEEVRVLGALMEKELSTPDYYPLTLNGLVGACNQRSNRDPVVSYSRDLVEEVLAGLREKQLAVASPGSRAVRYGHNMAGKFGLVEEEATLLCLLMLRGPQTAGELRGRSARLQPFATPEVVTDTLEEMAEMGLVKKLPLQPGRKEPRWCHLFCGEPREDAAPAVPVSPLRQEVDELRARLETLEREFAEFKRQFE
jgi:uncharacterized protein YceH (UPF0502 family)